MIYPFVKMRSSIITIIVVLVLLNILFWGGLISFFVWAIKTLANAI